MHEVIPEDIGIDGKCLQFLSKLVLEVNMIKWGKIEAKYINRRFHPIDYWAIKSYKIYVIIVLKKIQNINRV